MLVLIAGITGGFGLRLAKSALAQSVSVRGLGRSPEKLDSQFSGALDSFVTIDSYYDIPALERAVAGVDAVICAYAPTPVMNLDAHLLLLRATERAGIKIFLASSWGHDWTNLKYGEFEYYNPHIAFETQVAMTSTIRPVYMFVGTFSNLLYTPYAPGGFDTSGPNPKIRFWGDGDTRKWHWSDLDDVAEWTVDILFREEVQNGEGGFFRMHSAESTIGDFAAAYESVTGTKVDVVREGSVQDLEEKVAKLRQEKGRERFFEYLPDVSTLLGIQGKWRMAGLTETGVPRKRTTLEEYVKKLTKKS